MVFRAEMRDDDRVLSHQSLGARELRVEVRLGGVGEGEVARGGVVEAESTIADGAVVDADAEDDGGELAEAEGSLVGRKGEESAEVVAREDGLEGGAGLLGDVVVLEGDFHAAGDADVAEGGVVEAVQEETLLASADGGGVDDGVGDVSLEGAHAIVAVARLLRRGLGLRRGRVLDRELHLERLQRGILARGETRRAVVHEFVHRVRGDNLRELLSLHEERRERGGHVVTALATSLKHHRHGGANFRVHLDRPRRARARRNPNGEGTAPRVPFRRIALRQRTCERSVAFYRKARLEGHRKYSQSANAIATKRSLEKQICIGAFDIGRALPVVD